MSITLHRERGVNPRLTFCPRCGKEANELVLLGAHEAIGECCGITVYGGGRCPKCNRFTERVGTIGEHDRLPASQPCDECGAELAEHAKVVAEGGVYFRCTDCNASGVIKATPFAAEVRKAHGIDAPAPCGVEFTEENCPACASSPA